MSSRLSTSNDTPSICLTLLLLVLQSANVSMTALPCLTLDRLVFTLCILLLSLLHSHIIYLMYISIAGDKNNVVCPIIGRVVSRYINHVAKSVKLYLWKNLPKCVGVDVQLTSGIQDDHMSNVSVGVDKGRDIHEGRREGCQKISPNTPKAIMHVEDIPTLHSDNNT